jgi:phosphopantetheine--protein transferase-like protein
MDKIVGCGIDIEELDRFKKFIPTHTDIPDLTNLVYSDSEIAANQKISPHLTFPLAFSCKEAFFKAFGVSWTNSPISWKDIELIFQDPKDIQQYSVRLNGYAGELFEKMHCSRFETAIKIRKRYIIFEVILFDEIS